MASGWLGNLGLAAGTMMLRNLLTSETSPNKVIEVKLESYSKSKLCFRDDAMVLYETDDKSGVYQIVLHRPCSETLTKVYSLFRTNSYEEAQMRFLQLQGKLEMLLEIAKELYNINGIQKICDIVRDNPGWTSAHLAAYFGLTDCFQNKDIISLLNQPDGSTGLTPLHLAVKTNNLRCVQTLVNAKASLDPLDHDGNSVYHFAAVTTKEIINALSSESVKSLNYRNIEGYTPLHVACRADKPECVRALLKAGADANVSSNEISNSTAEPLHLKEFFQGSSKSSKLYDQDMKFGGTPLHWSCSREVINTLIDMGCNVNSLNFDNRTALHIMVLRNRLECVVALLSREINIDVCDIDGNTALHLAVKEGNLSIVKALIVFGANISLKNKSGETARHLSSMKPVNESILYSLHAVGASRCSEGMNNCGPGCSVGDNSFDGIPPPVPPSPVPRDLLDSVLTAASHKVRTQKTLGNTKGGRLLCLDGGGIRGLLLVIMLLELEKAAGQPITHCFDWIAGTSTGGILALGLAAGKSLQECLCMYFGIKERAFSGGRPYSSEPLENVLKETLGENTVMAEVKTPKIMVTAALADRKPVQLHLFRNYHPARDILQMKKDGLFKAPPEPEDQLMWRAARATGAAPSYFRAFGRFLDGGLISNNPTLDAMTEIHEYNVALKHVGREEEAKPLSVVVSLGTGLPPVSPLKEIDVFRPESLWDTARLAMGISSLAQLLVDQATSSDGSVVDRARSWCSMIGVPYYRFSPQLTEDIMMDEKSDDKLVNMLWEAKAYMREKHNLLVELATLLNM